jgi:hypothetical protein
MWGVFLKAVFGLPMTEAEAAGFQRHTGRQVPPDKPAREAWLIVGRRGGKSRIAALVAVYLACVRDYQPLLAPGERGTVMVIAADRRQAGVVFRYIEALITGVPMLAALIERRTREAIYLTNGVVLEVQTASFRAVRGYTVVGVVCDELAFWRSEESSANPDTEILNALRPGMATVPEAVLLGISSPYARRGALWEAYRDHYGRDGDPVLVWQAHSEAMNPNLDPAVIQADYEQDAAVAAAEWGAEFRRDIESYVSREAVEACVIAGRHERPPRLRRSVHGLRRSGRGRGRRHDPRDRPPREGRDRGPRCRPRAAAPFLARSRRRGVRRTLSRVPGDQGAG